MALAGALEVIVPRIFEFPMDTYYLASIAWCLPTADIEFPFPLLDFSHVIYSFPDILFPDSTTTDKYSFSHKITNCNGLRLILNIIFVLSIGPNDMAQPGR